MKLVETSPAVPNFKIAGGVCDEDASDLQQVTPRAHLFQIQTAIWDSMG